MNMHIVTPFYPAIIRHAFEVLMTIVPTCLVYYVLCSTNLFDKMSDSESTLDVNRIIPLFVIIMTW